VLRLSLALAALALGGCFVDSVGLPPPVGGSGDGASASDGGGDISSAGGSGGSPGAGGSGGRGTGGAPPAQHCEPGELATNIEAGQLVCAPVAAVVSKAIADSCSVFYGWSDNCDVKCEAPPNRVGRVSSTSCLELTTGDSTCQAHNLGDNLAVPLFGWDLDGGADTGDRFYSAIRCAPPAARPLACGEGGFVTAYDGDTPACNALDEAVIEYVRPSCALVRGWRDQCGGCIDPPTKYVSSTSASCDIGEGGFCAQATLGDDVVELASFDTDGNVGEDDKFHFGLRCESVTSTEAVAEGTCPSNQFVVGLDGAGGLLCSNLEELSMRVFRDRCALYAGWLDNCDDCTDAPSKWGRVTDGGCANNAAADDTCSTMELAGQTVDLYGLNVDGGVNGNDKFYMGFRCE
jgi:hypothetical protein